MNKIIKVLALVAGFVPALAFAAWPAGQYKMTFYNDRVAQSASRGICIVGNGTWYGTNAAYPNWRGRWFAKGNELHLNGNYNNGAVQDAFELSRVSYGLSTGYWQEWNNSYTFASYLTVRFDRVGDICVRPATAALAVDGSTASLPPAMVK